MARITRRGIFTGILVLLLFLYLTFDPSVTQLFLFFLFGSTILYLLDKNITFPIELSESGRFTKIAIGVASVFGFYAIAGILVPILGGIFGFQSVAGDSIQSLYASHLLFTQFLPLAGAGLLVYLVWAWLIPIVENMFTIGLYEGLLDLFDSRPKTMAGIFAAIVIASVMALFHMSAKGAGIEATSALFVTLLFFLMVIILTIYTKDQITGYAAHITANTLALKQLIPTIEIPSLFLIIGGMVGLSLFLRAGVLQKIQEAV